MGFSKEQNLRIYIQDPKKIMDYLNNKNDKE